MKGKKVLDNKSTNADEKVNSLGRFTYIYYIAAFLPVAATFFVAFLPTVSHMSGKLILITLLYAMLNGTLEELFWRMTFHNVGQTNITTSYLIPTIIFTCWHLALLLCNGMSYHGGALALVGGAGFMGFLWGMVVYKTNKVKITIVAHVLVNFFAFSQLLYGNFA